MCVLLNSLNQKDTIFVCCVGNRLDTISVGGFAFVFLLVVFYFSFIGLKNGYEHLLQYQIFNVHLHWGWNDVDCFICEFFPFNQNSNKIILQSEKPFLQLQIVFFKKFRIHQLKEAMSQNSLTTETLYCGKTLAEEQDYLSRTIQEGEIPKWDAEILWKTNCSRILENVYTEYEELDSWAFDFWWKYSERM